MGILSSMFNKMGHWHVRQLVKDCAKLIIEASMHVYNQKNNPYLTDSALDSLIEHGHFDVMQNNEYQSLKEKFTDFIKFFVWRNLGRDIDYISGESVTLYDEIEKVWPILMVTKDGIQQELKQ